MGNRQLPQKTDKTEKPYLYESLDICYQDAILYAFSGWRYVRIAKELKVKYSTVRGWFEKGGICKAAYEELKKEHAKENMKRIKAMRDKLEYWLPDMLEVLIDNAVNGEWRAAVAILDRAGYMPYRREIRDEKEDEEKQIVVEIISILRDKVKESNMIEEEGNSSSINQNQ